MIVETARGVEYGYVVVGNRDVEDAPCSAAAEAGDPYGNRAG